MFFPDMIKSTFFAYAKHPGRKIAQGNFRCRFPQLLQYRRPRIQRLPCVLLSQQILHQHSSFWYNATLVSPFLVLEGILHPTNGKIPEHSTSLRQTFPYFIIVADIQSRTHKKTLHFKMKYEFSYHFLGWFCQTAMLTNRQQTHGF